MFRLGNNTADGKLTTSLFFITHSWWQRCVMVPLLIKGARFSKHMEDSKDFFKTEVCRKGSNFKDRLWLALSDTSQCQNTNIHSAHFHKQWETVLGKVLFS